MYDLFLRIIREELSSSKIVNIPQTRINEYYSFMKNSLSELHVLDKDTIRYFNETIKNIEKDVDLLIRFRIVKHVLGSNISPNSFDNDMFSIIDSVIEYMKELYTGFYIGSGEKILVVFKKNCMLDNRVYRKGDIVWIDWRKGFSMFIDKCIEVVKEPYIMYMG